MADRYAIADQTIGLTAQGRTIKTLVTSAVLTYANTNQTLFTLASTQPILEANKTYHLKIKVIAPAGGTAGGRTITIRTVSLPEANATPLTTGSVVASAAWDSKVITLPDALTTAGQFEEHYLEDITKRGEFLYLSYQYSGDPTRNPSVEIKLCEV
jgi:hypothetical protein